MTFNSFVFVAFFAAVYAGYLLLQGRLRVQNTWLLAASFLFYGYWDWRFLFLLLGTACIDFVVGLLIDGTEVRRRRKLFLAISIVANLSVLGFFKYFNFFASSFADLLGLFGPVHAATLQIILPIGLSFYTFQAMSYTINVYRRATPVARHLPDFLLYVSFFPQLVAGPISRSGHLLPQVTAPRIIRREQVDAALFLLLWGYFKKVVIADNCALVANRIFNDYERFHGLDLIIGMLAFTVQIYCDFSGYTDIARGLAKLMGFDLMLNFRLPYFAVDPADFWTRWHISLSSWLRDYLYIPLGGNRGGRLKTHRNLALTMLLGGLWHGAAWNYVLWGAYHGALLILYRIFDRGAEPARSTRVAPPSDGAHRPLDEPSVRSEPLAALRGAVPAAADPDPRPPAARFARARFAVRMLLMFGLTVVGWVFFRSRSAGQIAYMLAHAGTAISSETGSMAYTLVFFTAPLLLVQVHQHLRRDLLAPAKLALAARIPLYTAFLLGIFVFGVRESIEFIYFQF